MNQLINIVAPRNFADFLFKSFVLVAVFTLVDWTFSRLTAELVTRMPWVDTAVTFAIATPFGLFVMLIMASQRRLQRKLSRMAQIDALTGLQNRRRFFEAASAKLETDECAAVLMVDVDHFKRINDQLGHYVGDVCLQTLADHLQRAVGPHDLVGRLGGEEFGIYLSDVDDETAAKIADRICKPVTVSPRADASFVFDDFQITMSVGRVAALPNRTLADLLHDADMAMYQAKQNGRGRVESWQEIIDELRSAS